MNEPPADPAVADYLRRLDQALGDLPADRRREIVEDIGEHIDAVRRDRPGDIDALLARLGTPEQIAAAAREDAALPQRGRPSPLELAAVALLTVGTVVTAGVGWIAGIVLLWVASGWTRARKIGATLLTLIPFALIVVANVLDLAGVTGVRCPDGTADPDCPGGVPVRPGLGTAVGLAVILSWFLVPVLVARFLGRPLWPRGWADVRATLRSMRPASHPVRSLWPNRTWQRPWRRPGRSAGSRAGPWRAGVGGRPRSAWMG